MMMIVKGVNSSVDLTLINSTFHSNPLSDKTEFHLPVKFCEKRDEFCKKRWVTAKLYGGRIVIN